MSEKSDQRALRAPDAFQRAGGEVRDWLIRRGNVAFMVGAVALAAALVFLLWNHFRHRTEEKADFELGKALRVVERGVGAGESAPGQPPPFSNQKEKDEQVVKDLSAFRTETLGTRAARTAGLPLGQAQLRLGKAEAALPLLEDFEHHAGSDDPLRVLALESEGYAHEAKGEYDAALAAFERMNSENKTEFMNGMALYHRARMLALKGQKQEAATAFAEVAVLAPTTAAARLAAERVAELAQQGIVATPPAVVAPLAGDAGRVP